MRNVQKIQRKFARKPAYRYYVRRTTSLLQYCRRVLQDCTTVIQRVRALVLLHPICRYLYGSIRPYEQTSTDYSTVAAVTNGYRLACTVDNQLWYRQHQLSYD